MTFHLIWTYSVQPEREIEFVRAYGADGTWARFFRSSPSYRGTRLIRCDEDHTYVTIDDWESREAYAAFIAGRRLEYDELDARCAALTLAERPIGAGEDVG